MEACGDLGFWGFGSLGILAFGIWKFGIWRFEGLRFGILGVRGFRVSMRLRFLQGFESWGVKGLGLKFRVLGFRLCSFQLGWSSKF